MKTQPPFELLFFMTSLYFGKSNHLRIEKQTYFSQTVFIWSYLFWRFKKDSYRLKKIKFFYYAWKETTKKPWKVKTAKNIFSTVYVTGTTSGASINVFIHCDNWKALFFTKVYRYPEDLFNRYLCYCVLSEAATWGVL